MGGSAPHKFLGSIGHGTLRLVGVWPASHIVMSLSIQATLYRTPGIFGSITTLLSSSHVTPVTSFNLFQIASSCFFHSSDINALWLTSPSSFLILSIMFLCGEASVPTALWSIPGDTTKSCSVAVLAAAGLSYTFSGGAALRFSTTLHNSHL